MPNIEEVTAKYIELRDRKTELAKRQSEEMRPLNEAMNSIESWLMEQMNTLGVDSFKTASGTPYKATQNSVKLADAGAFKGHVFAPAIEALVNYLGASGHPLLPVDRTAIEQCLQEKIRWDMVDFRAGKKGILEEFEQTQVLPPGVQLESFSVVNIRRS